MTIISIMTAVMIGLSVLAAVFIAIMLIRQRTWKDPTADFDPLAEMQRGFAAVQERAEDAAVELQQRAEEAAADLKEQAESAKATQSARPSAGQVQHGGLGCTGSLIFLLTFGAVGLGGLGAAAYQTYIGLSSYGWPTAQGTVETSYVSRYTDSDNDTMYETVIEYRYVVEGEEYMNDRVHVGDDVSTNFSGPHERRVERFPQGSVVPVYYRPGNPADSLLQPGLSMGILFPLLFGVIFGGVALGTTVASAGSIQDALTSRRWPTVPGEIISAEVVEYRDSDGDLMYRPMVRYKYEVDGEPYAGTRVSMADGMSTSWAAPAEKVVKAYPPGTPVQVYVEPGDPTSALLQPGMGRLNVRLLMVLVISIAMGVAGLVVFVVMQ